MDVVYSRAFCTIVAASGEDANAGIPGWGIIRRRAQHVSEILPGVNVILKKGIYTYLKQTRYDTRGWTFQEYFLSPRRIIFVNSQAYYLCRKRFWREEDAQERMLAERSYVDESLMSLLNIFWMHDEFDTHAFLTNMLWHYTTRQLTHESDILDAMGGICRAMSIRCKCIFFQGMPVAALDMYLCFDTTDGTSVKPAKRRRGFPSYSWTGWHGRIQFKEIAPAEVGVKTKNDWLSNQTWIVWYKYEPLTGEVSRIWDISQNPSFLEATEDDIGYRSRRSFRPKSENTRLSCNIEITRPSRRQHIVRQAQYSYPLLQFWTVSVYFNATFFSRDQAHVDIFDRNGDYCGCAYQNAVLFDFHIDESEPIELIILSECCDNSCERDKQKAWGKTGEDGSSISSTGENYFEDSEGINSFFWALWIYWDNGVAERLGIARIFQAAIEESFEPGPVWKEILLG